MSDTLSLTLPRVTDRVKRKIRRPRKPTPLEAVFLMFAVSTAALAIAECLDGRRAHFVWAIATDGLYWHAYLQTRRGFAPWRPWWLGCVPIAALITIDVMGIK